MKQHGLCALKKPLRFLSSTPFKIIFTLYAATYVVANGTESLCKAFASEIAAGPVIFISTFAVNVPLGIWKDVRFSQLFGAGNAEGSNRRATFEVARFAKRAPKAATAAFLTRDAITIFGSFALPGLLSDAIPSRLVPDPLSRTLLLQLLVPVLSQIGATPVHLIGLDHYSRQDGAKLGERLSRTRSHLPSTTTARCFRILPAFGFGVLVNKSLRERLQRAFGLT